MEVVINGRHGGFSLSEAGVRRYAELKGLEVYAERDARFSALNLVTYWTVPPEKRPEEIPSEEWMARPLEERQAYNEAYRACTIQERDIPRNDPDLIRVVKEMGSEADGRFAELRIVEIPDDVEWTIEEYDGNEWVAEAHRTWA